jgi:hypothetical protein
MLACRVRSKVENSLKKLISRPSFSSILVKLEEITKLPTFRDKLFSLAWELPTEFLQKTGWKKHQNEAKSFTLMENDKVAGIKATDCKLTF